MEHYRSNLRHVVRPETESDRADSTCVYLVDYEALYLAPTLREYGSYNSGTKADIALAYAEYIEMVVREEGRRTVALYAHTDVARETLQDVASSNNGPYGDVQLHLVTLFTSLYETPDRFDGDDYE